MSHEDFDIESLAAYLHLNLQQVTRLADRGKLPGRKVGGKWRFARAEIHHWLEDRIGLSDEEQLAEVEDALQRSAGAKSQEHVCIADLLSVEAVAVPLAARTKNSVIRSMVSLAMQTGLLWEERKMADAVRAREDMAPTALGNGVALLHPRRPMAKILQEPFLAFGRTATGIPFGGSHGGMTDLFFLICSTDDQGHLRALARLSRILAVPGLLEALREVPDPKAAHRLIAETEEGL